jgi:2-polyprenyl-3-methyl-5-hydroxy-6-metoxy-1,4-benzoquinol methylase
MLELKYYILRILNFFYNSTTVRQALYNFKLNLIKKKFRQEHKIKTLKKYKDYFYFFHPMFTDHDVKEFYSNTYFKLRKLSPVNISTREISQISHIKKNYDFKNKKVLNYGSGKGGFSYLCKLLGAKVSEIDLKTKNENSLDEGITHHNNINELKGEKFDLIYASHSLEHVTDIRKTLKEFEEISKEDTFFFFEIPEGETDIELRKKSGNFFPHLFYFNKNFFKNIFLKRNEDDFLEIYDNENFHKYSTAEHKFNKMVIWTNYKINSDVLDKIEY